MASRDAVEAAAGEEAEAMEIEAEGASREVSGDEAEEAERLSTEETPKRTNITAVSPRVERRWAIGF